MLWGNGITYRRGSGVTRQRKRWRYHRRLSRYHALTASEVRSFFGICRKRRGERLRLRSAGDCAWYGGSAGSEPAIKPERPETTGWLAKVGFRKENGRAVRCGGLAVEDVCGDVWGQWSYPKKIKVFFEAKL